MTSEQQNALTSVIPLTERKLACAERHLRSIQQAAGFGTASDADVARAHVRVRKLTAALKSLQQQLKN